MIGIGTRFLKTNGGETDKYLICINSVYWVLKSTKPLLLNVFAFKTI